MTPKQEQARDRAIERLGGTTERRTRPNPPDRVLVTWCPSCSLTQFAFYQRPAGHGYECPVCTVPMHFVRYQLAQRRG